MGFSLTKEVPEEEKETKKEFRPGEHVIFKRFVVNTCNHTEEADFTFGSKLEIPEGYQIVSFKTKTYSTWNDGGRLFDRMFVEIWCINNKRVLVTPVYNERLRKYDYSVPGTVVETMVEEPGPELSLKYNN